MDLKAILTLTENVVREAGAYIQSQRVGFDNSFVNDKSLNQLVSYVDVETEKLLVSKLSDILPKAGFIGEETATDSILSQDFTWVIDPLDGTTNFIHGLPVYCVSVGLLHFNVPVLGIVFEMNRNEMFTAYKDGGAFLNGKKINVTQTQKLNETLIATGFPYYDFENMKSYLNVLTELMKSTRGLRRMGSAAVDLAYTACGRFDAFFEYSLSPWDVAGGACIVKEAGGTVMDFRGGENYLFGKEIIACNPFVAKKILNLIQSKFY
jgi:myo-inositol-1(or 4)-monophosphatase